MISTYLCSIRSVFVNSSFEVYRRLIQLLGAKTQRHARIALLIGCAFIFTSFLHLALYRASFLVSSLGSQHLGVSHKVMCELT